MVFVGILLLYGTNRSIMKQPFCGGILYYDGTWSVDMILHTWPLTSPGSEVGESENGSKKVLLYMCVSFWELA